MCTLINVTHAHSTTLNSHKYTGDRWQSRWWKHRKRSSEKRPLSNHQYDLRFTGLLYFKYTLRRPRSSTSTYVNTIFKHGKIKKKNKTLVGAARTFVKSTLSNCLTLQAVRHVICHIFDHAQKHTLALNDFSFVVAVLHWFWDTAIALLHSALNSRLFIFVVVFSLCN